MLRGFNLQVADQGSLSDPFVVLWHRGKKLGQTKVKNNTLNPVWDQDGKSSTFTIEEFRTANDPLAVDVGGLQCRNPDFELVSETIVFVSMSFSSQLVLSQPFSWKHHLLHASCSMRSLHTLSRAR